jgi:lipopolysaccharide export system permease protein
MMVWERTLYKEIVKIMSFVLCSFFALFIIVDCSAHLHDFLRIQQGKVVLLYTYYGLQFVKRLDVLLPLALLVTTIKILRDMSQRHELLTLQVAGLSLKRIVRPFLLSAAAAVLCNLLSNEFLLPPSIDALERFHSLYLKKPHTTPNLLHVIELEDHSRLVFQDFDRSHFIFHDLFWIRSTDDLWRIKSATLTDKGDNCSLHCHYVDHITREPGAGGGLHKTASYEELELSELMIDMKRLEKGRTIFATAPLSQLVKKLQIASPHANAFKADLVMRSTRAHLPLLMLLALLPSCLHYSRFRSPLLLYSVAIFGTIAAFVLIQAGAVFIENQALSIWSAMILPFALFLFGTIWRFIRFV